MNRNKKIGRIFAFLLALCMLLTSAPMNVYAETYTGSDAGIFGFSGSENGSDDGSAADEDGSNDATVSTEDKSLDEGSAEGESVEEYAQNEDQTDPANENSDAENALILMQQTIAAVITTEPTATGRLKKLAKAAKGLFSTKAMDPEITLTGLLPEGATVEAYPVSVSIPDQTVLTAYNITIYAPVLDEDGNDTGEKEEWQPEESVSVSIDDPALADVSGRVNIYHMEDKNSDAEYVTATAAEEAVVSFDADSFSVYVVSQDQKGFIYKFMSPEGDEYTQLRQTLFDGDTLVKPADPVDNGRIFKQWNKDGAEFTFWGAVTVEDTQDGMVTVELTAIFEDDNVHKYHVNFFDQSGNVYYSYSVNEDDTIDPNGKTPSDAATYHGELTYTALQVESGTYLTFRYWTADLYDLDIAGHPKEYDATKLSGKNAHDVNLYPYCAPTHWLKFDGNRAAAGDQSVPYTAAVLVLEGEVPETVGTPSGVSGYTFDGWYTKAKGGEKIYDADGKRVAAPSGSSFTYAFEHYLYTGGSSLDYDPTLYAHWTAHSAASYTVSYYIQKPTDAVDASDDEKEYDFYKMHEGTFSGNVGDTVGLSGSGADNEVTIYTAEQVANDTSVDPSGLKLNTVNSQTVTILPDGSTSFKVYYDRKDYWIRFGKNKSTNVTPPVLAGGAIYTIHELYGHSIEDAWNSTKNENLDNTSQWRKFNNKNSNVAIWYTMPCIDSMDRDDAYHKNDGESPELWYIWGDKLTNPKTFERIAHVENVENDQYTVIDEYKDSRKMTQAGVSVSESLLTPLTGFTVIRLEGSNGTYVKSQSVEASRVSQTPNYQYYNPSSESNKNNSISESTTTNTALLGYYGEYDSSGTGTGTYKVDVFYQRNRNSLTLKYVLDGVLVAPSPAAGTTIPNNGQISGKSVVWDGDYKVKYGAQITDYLYDYASDHENVKNVKNDEDAWWFWDQELTNPVTPEELADMEMPDYPVTLYQGLRTAYAVDVDPNGGTLDGKNQSTWFNVNKGEAIAEYTVTRDYVLWSEMFESFGDLPTDDEGSITAKLYKYVYTTREIDEHDGTALRSAVYVQLTEDEQNQFKNKTNHKLDDGSDVYVYYPGVWAFQYWYNEEGSDTAAYNFSDEITSPVKLKAKWEREGSYSIVYNADANGTSVRAPKDANRYIEGAKARVLGSADQPGNKQFRFWGTYAQGSANISAYTGTKYYPNRDLTVGLDLTPGQAGETNRVITLYAWYEDGEFTQNSFADYEFYIANADGTWSDGEGDTPYYVQTISPGETLVMPPTPSDPDTSRNGAFVGWYNKDYTERYDGFGVIGTPKNTKLYAKFSKIVTVTYKDSSESNARTITVQTYESGDILSTIGVEFVTTNDQYVKYWTNGTKHYAYNGKGASSDQRTTNDGKVTADMTIYPEIGDVYVVSFDSQGGSYVDPIEFPHDNTRWTAEPVPTKAGYDFVGWYTAPQTNDAGTEGGVRYAFDQPLTTWASANSIDLKANNPLKLYAHWVRNSEDIKTTVTVNYYIQNTERSGYFLWNNEVVKDQAVGSSYTLTSQQMNTAKIAGYETFPDNDDSTDDRAYFHVNTTGFTYTDTNGNGMYDEGENFEGDISDGLRSDGYDATHAVTVLADGATVVNVYFDRNLYTLKFDAQTSITLEEVVGATMQQDNNTSYTNGRGSTLSYIVRPVKYTTPDTVSKTVPVWLGMDISDQWVKTVANSYKPGEDSELEYDRVAIQDKYRRYYAIASKDDNSYNGKPGTRNYAPPSENDWARTFTFSGWTEYKSGDTFTDATKNNDFVNVSSSQAFISKTLLPIASQSSYTLKAEYTYDLPKATEYAKHPTWDQPTGASTIPSNPVTIHYFVTDAEGKTIEMPDYQQTLYGITGTKSGNTDGSTFTPDDASWAKIEAARLDIPNYSYDISRREGKVRNTTVNYPLYTYTIPTDYVYSHRFASHTFPALQLTNATNVREGQFNIRYTYLGLASHAHGDKDVVYKFPYASNYILGRSINSAVGTMTTAQFRAMIEANRGEPTGYDPVQEKGNHIYLYYQAGSFALNLKSQENEKWSATKSVTFSTFLGDERRTAGYLYEGETKVEPPVVTGKVFAGWAVSEDSDVIYSGVMPDYPLTLYAHYVDAEVTVTTVGVKSDGELQRDDGTIKRDAKDVPVSWSDDNYTNTKIYGTRLQEFELPAPALGENEVFYGWKRVLDDGSLAMGYVSNNTHIQTDTRVAPYIVVNRGGDLKYYANNGSAGTDNNGLLFTDGGYYFGGTVKARLGTTTGTDSGTALTNDGTATGMTFVCWNTKADGTGDDYYPGDTVPLPDEGEIKLYARYAQKREITLVYHLNGGDAFVGDGLAVSWLKDGVLTNTEATGAEKVIAITFSDYDKTDNNDSYPNTEYGAALDKDGKAFTASYPDGAKSLLCWNTKDDGTGSDVLSSDKIRVSTVDADANGFIHMYAKWVEGLPVTVYEVTLGDYDNAELQRIHKGQMPYLTATEDKTFAIITAVTTDAAYNAYTRNSVPAYDSATKSGDEFGKAVLSSADGSTGTEITFIRYNSSTKKWQYATKETQPDASSADWIDFGADGLKVYFFPSKYEPKVYWVYQNADGTLEEITAEQYYVSIVDSTEIGSYESWSNTTKLTQATEELTSKTDSTKKVPLKGFAFGPVERASTSGSLASTQKPMYMQNSVNGMLNAATQEGLASSTPHVGEFAIYVIYGKKSDPVLNVKAYISVGNGLSRPTGDDLQLISEEGGRNVTGQQTGSIAYTSAQFHSYRSYIIKAEENPATNYQYGDGGYALAQTEDGWKRIYGIKYDSTKNIWQYMVKVKTDGSDEETEQWIDLYVDAADMSYIELYYEPVQQIKYWLKNADGTYTEITEQKNTGIDQTGKTVYTYGAIGRQMGTVHTANTMSAWKIEPDANLTKSYGYGNGTAPQSAGSSNVWYKYVVDNGERKQLFSSTSGTEGFEEAKYLYMIYSPATVKLTVTKTVGGEMGDTTKDFSFTLNGLSATGSVTGKKYSSATDTTGSDVNLSVNSSQIKFTLKHGERIELNVPVGDTLTLAETGLSTLGYQTWMKQGTTAYSTASKPTETEKPTITLSSISADTTVQVLNWHDNVAPTGVNLRFVPYILIALAGALLLLMRRRRRLTEK